LSSGRFFYPMKKLNENEIKWKLNEKKWRNKEMNKWIFLLNALPAGRIGHHSCHANRRSWDWISLQKGVAYSEKSQLLFSSHFKSLTAQIPSWKCNVTWQLKNKSYHCSWIMIYAFIPVSRLSIDTGDNWNAWMGISLKNWLRLKFHSKATSKDYFSLYL
jgi:hypothetical protein